jgi:hypothetical protein
MIRGEAQKRFQGEGEEVDMVANNVIASCRRYTASFRKSTFHRNFLHTPVTWYCDVGELCKHCLTVMKRVGR